MNKMLVERPAQVVNGCEVLSGAPSRLCVREDHGSEEGPDVSLVQGCG
jgi:hypothetical protein